MIVLLNNDTVKKGINEHQTKITEWKGRPAVSLQVVAVLKKKHGFVSVWNSLFFLDTHTYRDYQTILWNGPEDKVLVNSVKPIEYCLEKSVETEFDKQVLDYCLEYRGKKKS